MRRFPLKVALPTILIFAAAMIVSTAGAKDHKGAAKHPPAAKGVEKPAPAPQPAAPAAAEPAAPAASPAAQTPAPEPQKQAAEPTDPKEREIAAAFGAGLAAATKGPAKAALLDQAEIAIGEGQSFVPKAQGLRILRALGNNPDSDGFAGLILGEGNDDTWIIVVRYIKEGFVKDDDAKSWSADELLSSLREGTEEANEDRRARGFGEIEVVRWIEQPTYDAAKKRLVWSILSKEKGQPDSQASGVNYNTYALGREGYFSLNLLTDVNHVEGYKPVAKTLLSNLAYRSGKRYEDFNASTDQIAAYGLAALVGGVAAKKLGLLALAAGFAAKFAKLIVLAVVGAGAAISRFFKRNNTA